MPSFLDATASNASIIKTIKGAGDQLYLISPYVQLASQVAQWLSTVDRKGVETHLVCRFKDLHDREREKLKAYENVTVYDVPELHAKCYANGSGIVLTSLNLYEASRDNFEMGVYFDAEGDPDLYREAMEEARHIIEHASPVSLGGEPKKKRRKMRSGFFSASRKSDKSATPSGGHCIRCGTSTVYNPKRPYCPKCFKQWSQYRNPTYADDRCHGCGKEEQKGFSLEKPECYPCYKKMDWSRN